MALWPITLQYRCELSAKKVNFQIMVTMTYVQSGLFIFIVNLQSKQIGYHIIIIH
jgi:hypothetical protein